MSNPTDHLRQAALQRLLIQLPTLRGAVLARTDGFAVASASQHDFSASRLSAMASSMLALGQATLGELALGDCGSVLVEGRQGKVLLIEVPHPDQPLVLALVGSDDTVTGALLWAARQCVQQLTL